MKGYILTLVLIVFVLFLFAPQVLTQDTVTISDGENDSRGQVFVLEKADFPCVGLDQCVVSIDATTPTGSAAYNNMSAGKCGQTFTAEDTSVCGFQFKIGTDGGIHGEISVDSDAVLYDISGTEPVELARKTFPAPISGVTDFFFDHSIPVQVGKKYFIGIDTGDSAWGLYQICNCQCSCYDGGGRGGFLPDGSFSGGVNNTDDYYFKVYKENTNVIISGKVTDSNENGIDDVTLMFVNDAGGTETAVTGPDGSYSHSVSFGWCGTLTPSKEHYDFSPAKREYTSVNSNQTNQDFTAYYNGTCVVSIDATTPTGSAAYNNMPAGKYGQTFTAGDTSVCGFQFKIGTDGGIHGEISVDSDAVLYDVSGTEPVELARKTFPAPISGVTDFFFDYSIPVQVGKKYFIGIDTGDSAWGLYQICNCQCSCYDGGGRGGFLPDGSFYGGVNNTDDYYFKVYKDNTIVIISGKVTDSNENGIDDVTLMFVNDAGGTETAVTGPDGSYSHHVSFGWCGTLTPSKENYDFSPAKRKYTNVTSNRTNQDFTAHYNYNGPCVVSIDATTPSGSAAYNNMPAGKYGQTFTALDTSVCGFQFKIGTDGGIHGEISVDSDAVLYDVSGTEPVELTRKTFPAPIRGVTDFFFDYSIPVQVGKKYFIGIDTGDSAWGLYQICNCQCSCYDGGGRGGFLPDGSFYGGVNNTDDYYFKVYTTTTGKPEISLNRTSITFGTILNGQAPPSQSIIISNTKTGILNWTSTQSETWVQVSQESGTGYCVMNMSVNPSGLSVGTYTGTISISDPNASNSPQTVSVTLNVYNPDQTSAPFGTFATPIDGSTVRSSIPVTGWVLDDIGVESVKIYRGEINNLVYIGDAVFVEGARPDVEQAYPGYPNNYQAGWGYMMLTNFLPDNGNGTFKIYATAIDLEGYQVTLGTKTIICDNANAVKPFGAIDTPAQGGSAVGRNYRNQGWVLTPMPNSIPTDGSTINVIVDGINIGHPTYNFYRKDIAALFPGYANSNGALAYFDLDTTTYSNGVHTISWNVTDDAGNTDGIGSRYFSIRNTVSQASSGARELNVTRFKDLKEFPLDYTLPIGVKKGYRKYDEKVELFSNENGNTRITIKELGRIELHIANLLAGYMKVGNQLNSLPIGSTLDSKRDIFYWQPGPGFMGKYHLVFILKDQDGNMIIKNVIVNIVPK